MQKIFIIISILFIAGCSKESDKLTCEYDDSKNNHIIDMVTVYFDNDESVNYDKETIVFFENYDAASQYYDIIYGQEENSEYELIDNKVVVNISEELDGMTKEEVKSMYEKYGFVCK